ncbi:microtubule-associated protein 10 [Cyprinodon tularosa]|uniref:microtubule-associated protein 10 n=1 Tax=Cyprinodon tularosa TaxID=77115 RepID=UPI0018E251FE|nr:microtubule-associated protein 10 [Cyprinodon tularosa]
MMSAENLFSFELLVDHIRLKSDYKVTDSLAVGVRLLDFPTLLIYQRPSTSLGCKQSAQKQRDEQQVFLFNRGKSCLFKMNLDSLHVHLSSSPLYAMVLDVTEEQSPRLVGSSLVSLAEAMDRIKLLSGPSAHSGKGVAAICNLTGERIGTISLSYKLGCLGATLLPHITEGRGVESTSTPGGKNQELSKEKCNPYSMCSPRRNESEFSIKSNDAGDCHTLLEESREGDCAESQTKNTFEEDLTVFCPPHLYYSSATHTESGHSEPDNRLLNMESEAFPFEDAFCDIEEDRKKVSASKDVHQEIMQTTKTSSSQEASGVTTNILREALQQLPLLSALVSELSQLTIHPNPAPVTGPASEKYGNSPLTHPQHKTTQLSDTHLNPLPPPRNCSTPNPVKMQDHQKQTLSSRKSQMKKLKYGTTKTFHLRLKQISPRKANHHECVELKKSAMQTRNAEEKKRSRLATLKSKDRGFPINRGYDLDKNLRTVVQSGCVDTALTETVTLKPETQQIIPESHEQTVSEYFPPQKEPKCISIHIPRLHGDRAPLSKDAYKHQSESDQSDSQSERVKFRALAPDLTKRKNARSNSPESAESSNIENEANYADDFDSLESSNASSPKSDKSPAPSTGRTTKTLSSPDSNTSDSRSDGFQKRAALRPVLSKTLKSPNRDLMGTHIIQPRTRSSAPSFSSDTDDDDDMKRPSSSEIVCFRKQESEKIEQSSSSESVSIPRSEKEKLPRNQNLLRGLPAESISSLEDEELEDELGSLDFRKGYQHISELVASKLPGYTM